MALPLYLAMTAAEMGGNVPLPQKLAYMACHFSPYGTGLSNLPSSLPPGSMLILNDRIPVCGHDKHLIANQLADLTDNCSCECILLDFQRPDVKETAELAELIVQSLSCPVGVSMRFAEKLDCPVFLPPVPPDIPIWAYLSPWEGREVWLEAALDGQVITVLESGSSTVPLFPWEHPEGGQQDAALHCRYLIHMDDDVRFTLFRTPEDLDALLAEAEALGVTRAVGLWQELGR